MKSTGIVICNYNKSAYVVSCIQSILEMHTDDYDIYVVDNASSDDSVKRIQSTYQNKVNLLLNTANLGGSGGFNTGIREVLKKGYEYIWCLDNDTLVDENALTVLKTFLDNHPQTGMAASRIYNMENQSIIQQNGLIFDQEHLALFTPHKNVIEDGSIPSVYYSDAIATCSVLVRSSVIREIGLMPEENFLYWDDIEWGVRCNLAGYKVATLGDSKVLHAMGAKKAVENTFSTYYLFRNWIAFLIKMLPDKRIEQMADTVLKSLFDSWYIGQYRNELNEAKTIQFAYDDAIHWNLGKAPSDHFFDLDRHETKLNTIIRKHSHFLICVNEKISLAESIISKIEAANPSAEISLLKQTNDLKYEVSNSTCTTIILCNNIFSIEHVRNGYIYIDLEENIIETEADATKALNYQHALETFVFTQKPLFLDCVKKIRSDLPKHNYLS